MTSPPPASVNLELLIKLLKLTTSPHDGEALAAVRAANLQLSKVGGDWETFLRGKVTLIADPWAGQSPTSPSNGWPASPATPRGPGWRPGWRPPTQQPQAAQPQPQQPQQPQPQPQPRQRRSAAVPPASASDL